MIIFSSKESFASLSKIASPTTIGPRAGCLMFEAVGGRGFDFSGTEIEGRGCGRLWLI